jgi:hypothetical protein
VAQPALSAGEVKDFLDAKAQRAREEEERKAKAERERKAKEQSQAGATPAAATGAPASATAPQPSAPAQGAGQAPSGQTGGAPEVPGSVLGWIIGGIAVLVLLLIVWVFVRSKLAAHAIVDRYALFLSTLSYQHIRALRAGEPGAAADRLRLANEDLTRYLRFIRGEGAYIAKAANLPVRLEPDLDLAAYLSEPRNII